MSGAALIGIGGRLRSGKDVVADRLVAEHGFVKLGMSDALHEAMLAIDPILRAEVRYSDAIRALGYVETKELFPEARRLLQNLGTEVGRNMVGENTWVDITARKIAAHRGEGRRVVVTGIRFPNEVRMVRDGGGLPVWVERPGVENASTHASENSVTATDFRVRLLNDGTLNKLRESADELVTWGTLR